MLNIKPTDMYHSPSDRHGHQPDHSPRKLGYNVSFRTRDEVTVRRVSSMISTDTFDHVDLSALLTDQAKHDALYIDYGWVT